MPGAERPHRLGLHQGRGDAVRQAERRHVPSVQAELRERLRCGIGVDLERPSERYWSTPIDGPAAGTSAKANWETMVSTYYKTAGWDRETGKPLPETMRELGLQSHLMPDA